VSRADSGGSVVYSRWCYADKRELKEILSKGKGIEETKKGTKKLQQKKFSQESSKLDWRRRKKTS